MVLLDHRLSGVAISALYEKTSGLLFQISVDTDSPVDGQMARMPQYQDWVKI